MGFDDLYADVMVQKLARSTVWVMRALTGQDQLRQRMAWALSQIMVVSLAGLPRDAETEVTYSPAMSTFLTHTGSSSFHCNCLRAVDQRGHSHDRRPHRPPGRQNTQWVTADTSTSQGRSSPRLRTQGFWTRCARTSSTSMKKVATVQGRTGQSANAVRQVIPRTASRFELSYKNQQWIFPLQRQPSNAWSGH